MCMCSCLLLLHVPGTSLVPARPLLAAGEWRADKRHGQGVCKFADGRKFRGEPCRAAQWQVSWDDMIWPC